jgi:hypothetical protein
MASPIVQQAYLGVAEDEAAAAEPAAKGAAR